MSVRWLQLVAGLAIVSGCSAAAEAPVRIERSWEADEAQIRAATEASAAAWNRGDLGGHLAIYADTVSFMTRDGPRTGVAAIEQAFTNSYFRDGMPRQRLSFEQVVVRRLGPEAALQTGRFVLDGGDEPTQSGWFTLIWVRTPDGWRAVHDHTS